MKKALLQLHIAILLWGFTGVLGQLISLDAIWLVWYRLGITLVSLWVFQLFFRELMPTTTQQKWQVGLAGGLQAIHWLFFFAAIKYANVAVALICLSSSSFFTAILEALLYKTRVKFKEIALSLLSIVGIVFIFYADFEFKIGIVFGILSALFVSLVPTFNKRQLVTMNPATVTHWSIIGGFITISMGLPFYSMYFQNGTVYPNLTDIGWLLVLSWLCTIITWRLSFAALKKVSAFTQNLLLNLEPIYGILLAALFIKEYKQYNFYFYCGIGIIICTVVLQSFFIYKDNKVK
jgi:drug/metabolite transporter (DMT)-like permease